MKAYVIAKLALYRERYYLHHDPLDQAAVTLLEDILAHGDTLAVGKPIMGTIEHWHIVNLDGNRCVAGINASTLQRIRTSRIVFIDKDTVETLNSIYMLGRPAKLL
jgi:hypothetical protein